MAFILIDRRKAGAGKSSPNRQKLIRRIKSFIKSSSPQNIGQGGVGGGKARNASPVKVAGEALEEPFFAYANDGDRTLVLIGNDEYDRDDEIDFPDDGPGGSGAGSGGQGEDEFVVNIARDEFLDLFFEDCELPNLTNEKFTEKLDNKFQPAGFSTTGSPAQLSIIRSYKQSLGRRWAMMGPHRQELEELETEQEELMRCLAELDVSGTQSGSDQEDQINKRLSEIQDRMTVLQRKIDALNGFDKVDLRYRNHESTPLKTVDAVLVMVMDISGSMDEERKKIARRWFALLYAFIKRRYTNTELVFIAHTDEPFEMSEDDFFSTRINGGTSVSPALEMVNRIILERYDPNQTNIYVSHASDGDNWESDNPLVINEMIGKGRLLNKIQLFSYVEVGSQRASWMGSTQVDSGLWETYEKVQEEKKKVTLAIIETADDCYDVFRKVFKKGN